MFCRHCYQKREDGSEICPLCKWPQGSLKITEEGVSRGTRESGSSYVEKENTKPVFSDPEPEYMYCRKCGTKLPADSVFCNKCGSSVNEFANPVQKKEPTVPSVKCSRCGGHHIRYDTVTEDVPAGCSTGCLYVLLALTILGLLIVIPLMLRKKTETVTYAVCLDCGNRWKA